MDDDRPEARARRLARRDRHRAAVEKRREARKQRREDDPRPPPMVVLRRVLQAALPFVRSELVTEAVDEMIDGAADDAVRVLELGDGPFADLAEAFLAETIGDAGRVTLKALAREALGVGPGAPDGGRK